MRRTSYIVLVVALIGMASPAVAQPVATQPAGATKAAPVEMLPAATPAPFPVSRDTGYRGFWWGYGKVSPFMFRQMSGAAAFEPMDHTPVAQYAAAADKTFFVYAAKSDAQVDERTRPTLRIDVGAYDHKTGTVCTPVILADNLPAGAHGCPALTLDDTGRLWVFVSVEGVEYPSFVLRSAKPYQIDAWEKVAEMDFRQPQAWYIPGQGFALLHVRMIDGKPRVHFASSPDGLAWSKPIILATFGDGQSCMSAVHRNKVGVAITYREVGQPAETREDLYYMESSDMGRTWQVFPRNNVKVPLTAADNPARIFDRTNWVFLLRDLAFDGTGNPVIFYLARHQKRVSPAAETRIWSTSRWIGREWESTGSVFSDSDYDAGCIEVERLVWYATIPTRSGPQPNSSGGEMVRWRSETQGRSWFPVPLTSNSESNHNCARRVLNSKPDCVVFWADGNTRKMSDSRLYFADRAGNVYRLPFSMKESTGKPELAWKAPAPPTQPASAASPSASAPAKPATAPF